MTIDDISSTVSLRHRTESIVELFWFAFVISSVTLLIGIPIITAASLLNGSTEIHDYGFSEFPSALLVLCVIVLFPILMYYSHKGNIISVSILSLYFIASLVSRTIADVLNIVNGPPALDALPPGSLDREFSITNDARLAFFNAVDFALSVFIVIVLVYFLFCCLKARRTVPPEFKPYVFSRSSDRSMLLFSLKGMVRAKKRRAALSAAALYLGSFVIFALAITQVLKGRPDPLSFSDADFLDWMRRHEIGFAWGLVLQALLTVLTVLIAWILFWMADRLRTRARMAFPKDVAHLAPGMGRNPVLFLRSFAKDDEAIDPPRRRFLDRFIFPLRPKRHWTDIAAARCFSIGPVVQVGAPEATGGTATVILQDTRGDHARVPWKEVVMEYLPKAALIVAAVWDSPSLRVEIAAISRQDYVGKTVFLFPGHGRREEAEAQVAVLKDCGVPAGDAFPALPHDRYPCCLFRDGTGWRVVVSANQTDIDYDVALQFALGRLPRQDVPAAAGPAGGAVRGDRPGLTPG